MDDKQLERHLNSVGKSCFVEYFYRFCDENLEMNSFVEFLMGNEGYTKLASETRVLKARKIIKAGRAMDALAIIANSTRVPREVSAKAVHLASFAK